MALWVMIIVSLVMLVTTAYTIVIRDVFNPLMLFNLSVGLSYAIYYFIFKMQFAVSNLTLWVYLVGLISYNIGFVVFSLIPMAGSNSTSNISINYSVKIRVGLPIRLIFIVACICLFYTIIYFTRLGGNVASLSTSGGSAVREAYIEQVGQAPLAVTYGKYLMLFCTMVFFYNYMLVSKHSLLEKVKICLLLGLTFITPVLTQSRADLMICAMPIFCIYFRLDKSTAKIKKYVVVAAALILMVGLLALLRQQNAAQTKFFSPQNAIMQYIGMPIVAFDQWISGSPGMGTGFMSIEPIDKLVSALHISSGGSTVTLAQLGQFNVYSYLENPYLDFGITGVLVWLIIIGFFCHFLYRKSQVSTNGMWLLFYSLYTYSMVMAFFAWQFTIVTFVYFAFFAIVISTRTDRLSKKGCSY